MHCFNCSVIFSLLILSPPICVANELGNIGEHQSAINLDKKVLQEDLRSKSHLSQSAPVETPWTARAFSAEHSQARAAYWPLSSPPCAMF